MQRRNTTPGPVDLGIIGGGQLARMTVERAAKLGLTTLVLDPSPGCPAAVAAHGHLCAGFDDPEGLQELVERTRVTTFDLEAPDATVLGGLRDRGHCIHPDPDVLATIQDKLRQREFLAARDFPVPRFAGVDEPTPDALVRFGLPLVQKARRGGYDGRGVAVIDGEGDLARMLPAPSVLEEKIPIASEISVLVARGLDGTTRTYPAVEMIFDPALNLIEGALFPARLDGVTAGRARHLATKVVQALGGVGIFAVELFVQRGGRLWVNEIAPRPHNSGHVTIEAAVTCQFEQHVRAVMGMPLGETSLVSPAAMVNLVGPGGEEGAPSLPGLAAALGVPGARLHLYGKKLVRPGRKMGHITVLDPDPVAALERARHARGLLGLQARRAA